MVGSKKIGILSECCLSETLKISYNEVPFYKTYMTRATLILIVLQQ